MVNYFLCVKIIIMKKGTKFSIIFIVLLLLLGIVAFVFAGKWTKDFQKYLTSQGSVEYAKANDIVITETKDGIKYWEMYAATGEYDAENVQADGRQTRQLPKLWDAASALNVPSTRSK